MTLGFAVVAHVILGLCGLASSYAVALNLRKRESNLAFLKAFSLLAILSYLGSWATGAYYYVLQYGKAVKPIIVAGKYPWAHTIFMESKEHIFLLIPFLSLMTASIIWFLGNRLQSDELSRKAVSGLALATFFLGVFVAIAGVFVSGAVR